MPYWREGMATKASIISAITAKIEISNCETWKIGLTHDLAESADSEVLAKHRCVAWSAWQTDSLSDARKIERYFIDKGAQPATCGRLSAWKPVYVYVVKR